jgi:predicted TIM-barrel fold metal-dependent hydrolase
VIIDAHTHVFPASVRERRESLLATEPAFAEIYADAGAAMATAGELLAHMDEAGVDRAIICNFAWHDDALIDETNEYLLGAAATSGGRLIPFVTPPLAGAGRHGGVDADEAVGQRKGDPRAKVRQLSSDGARGFGELRPASSGYALANSDEADLLIWASSAYDMPLLVHASEPVGHHYRGKAGGPIDDLFTFLGMAPSVTVIAAHWGGGLPFFAHMPEVRDALANVYVDTAASHLLYHPRIFRTMIDVLGAEKILWGSDFPLASQLNDLQRLHGAGLDEAELAAIAGGNAASLLSL